MTDQSLPVDSMLAQYRILARLGAGGMGEVYLAEDTRLNRKVAIKVLLPGEQTVEAAKRLVREARAAANLDHPNICAIHEVSESDGRSFIVMQYVEGQTLQARMRRSPLDLLETLAIAAQVVDALTEAHARGTIHRDIKPANIMISARGAVKVMDFGLATRARDGDSIDAGDTHSVLTLPGAVMGTVPYMSPEQVRGEPLDARSDIFSVGTMLYEMVSGQQPFADASTANTITAILTRDPAPLARYARDVPAELERIVAKAMRKDREARYQTTKDLLLDVQALRDELQFSSKRERMADLGATTSGPRSGDAAPPTGVIREAPVPVVRPRRSTHVGLLASAALVVVAAGGWFVWHRAQVQRAHDQIMRLDGLTQARNLFEAYDLAVEARKILPADPTIARLLPTITDTLSITTMPAGAQAYLQRYAPDAAGQFPPRVSIGITPIKDLQIARGQYILSMEKAGYAPAERSVSGEAMHIGTFTMLPPPIRVNQTLFETGTMPDGMTFVPGGPYALVGWARLIERRVKLDDYFIDKYEVSNRAYKEFIDAGGYLKHEYWKAPFMKDGRTLPWDEAMRVFKDRTALPGPRTWSGQTFPDGKADYPVTDISWYEAAAYAVFRGKELPTLYQWEKAARNGQVNALVNYMPWGVFYPGDAMTRRANFNHAGAQPVASSEFGMSPFGVYNMAGNVSEWSGNETSGGFAATGGAFGEPTYMFAQYAIFPGLYTSERVGFRCVRRLHPAIADPSAMRIDIVNEIPVYTASSDTDFNTWLAYYRYEKTPLDAKIVETRDFGGWLREKITFNGADGDRAIAYLYRPKNATAPLQVIHFMPPSDVEAGATALTSSMEDLLLPSVKAGRAAFGVVLRGYQERLRPTEYVEPEPTTVEYRDKIVNWVIDVRRGLDYLETRADIDAGRFAFFGISAGSRAGLLLTAIETRYRSVCLTGSGLRSSYRTWIAGANPIGFASHIHAPVLMIQGRYDENLPLKSAAEPLYTLLPGQKRLLVFDGGHVPSFEFAVTTINSWLDETLGPVKR